MEMSKDPVGGATTNFAEVTGADSIIFDRVYMHGTPNLESRRAIYIGGSTNVGIIDSYLPEFHCIAVTGSCTDSMLAGLRIRLPTTGFQYSRASALGLRETQPRRVGLR
jgi:hypothetical protein